MESIVLSSDMIQPHRCSQAACTHLQPLGEVRDLQTSGFVKFGKVNQQFMCDTIVAVLESDGVMSREPLGHVVCIEECNVGRV